MEGENHSNGSSSSASHQPQRCHDENNGDHQISSPSPSTIPFLPTSIVVEILSRVSVKSVLRCKCVCKLWLDLLSSSEFTKVHFSRAPTYPLLWGTRPRAGTLYLVEFERDFIDRDLIGRKSCYHDSNHVYNNCDDASARWCRHAKLKPTTKFGLPKIVNLNPKRLKHEPVVNSCNGLLCLRADPVVIYNPILRECYTLPKPQQNKFAYHVLGLGFSASANQYKVLQVTLENSAIVAGTHDLQSVDSIGPVAEVYTLGTSSWRRIGNAPRSLSRNVRLKFPAFLNGALHWSPRSYYSSIVSFKFEDENFGEIKVPPHVHWGSCTSIGELRGDLYICEYEPGRDMKIWVMKDYGVHESWTVDFKIDLRHSWERSPRRIYTSVDVFCNGDLLMYHGKKAVFITYYGCGFNFFKISDISKFLAVAHKPSFVSLKDIMGDNLTILNVQEMY